MKNRALIAIDLDGTLLTPDYRLLPYTKETLRHLEEDGATIVLSSGRPPRNILPYYEEIGLKSPIIAYNGHLLYNPSDPSFIRREQRISSSFLKGLILSFKGDIENMLLEANDDALYLEKDEPRLQPYFPYGEGNRKKLLSPVLLKNPFVAIFEVKREKEDAFQKRIGKEERYHYRHWRGLPFSEIAINEVDKGKGLRDIAFELGVEKEDIYAFGDRDNDRGMLRLAGHPFAMRSSTSPSLKEEFPLTEKGNAEEGVAHTLNDIFGLRL